MADEKIDPDLLTSLGLGGEDAQRFDRDKIREQRDIDEAKRKGSQYYIARHNLTSEQLYKMTQDEARKFREILVGPKFFQLRGEGNPSLPVLKKIPDEMLNQLKTSDEVIRDKVICSWLKGFGFAGLAVNDLDSAVNAFDILTGGKITEDEEIMGKLREATSENKSVGVEIAKKIQARRKLRAPSAV